jgi:hemolysin activation/secretion protein
MKQLNPTFLATSIGAMLLSGAASSALAQAPTTTPQDLERTAPPSRDADRRVTTAGIGTISLCPFRDSSIPVTINQVTVEGASVLPQASIDRSYKAVRGQATTLSVVCTIRENLILEYRRLGFPLTRVELVEQRIGSDGAIRFKAVEAGLQSVNITDNAKSAPFANVVNGYADQLKAHAVGRPLKWSEIERFALLMRDTPGVVARLELRPGAAAQAQAQPVQVQPNAADAPVTTPANIAPLDLFVTLEKPERFGGFMSLQRNSADVFGRYAGVVGAQARGVMPWGGDELSGVLYSTQTGRQAVGSINYEWRHGSGLLLKAMAAYAETSPGRAFAPLDLRGESTSFTLSASYPLVLRSALQIESTLGFDYVDQDNFIFEDQSISNDQIRVGSFKTSVLWRDIEERRAKANAWVEYRQGLDSFDATQPGDPMLSRIDADPQASLWRVRGEGEFRLRRNYPGIAVAADAQIADDVLVSFEQYQVGNLTIGRGYDPGTITGDRGYGAKVELLGGRYQPEGYDQFMVEPYAFYDSAHVESLSTAAIQKERDVASYGGGLRFRYADRVSLDIGGAQALDVPGLNQKKPGPQFLMNFTVQF